MSERDLLGELERSLQRRDRLVCGERSETGLTCGLQVDHGGDKHAGGDPLKWWTRDGVMIDFSAPAVEERTQ